MQSVVASILLLLITIGIAASLWTFTQNVSYIFQSEAESKNADFMNMVRNYSMVEAMDGIERTETYAYLWSPTVDSYPNTVYYNPNISNVVAMYWLNSDWPQLVDPDYVKDVVDTMPDGHHVIFSWNLHSALGSAYYDNLTDPDTQSKTMSIWWNNSVDFVVKKFNDFFSSYSAIGGKLDYAVLDFEGGMSNWVLSGSSNDQAPYRAIMADPRFSTQTAPILSSYSFPEPVDLISTVWDWWGKSYYLTWNALAGNWTAEYANNATFSRIIEYYPDANMSNFNMRFCNQSLTVLDFNGHYDCMLGFDSIVGNYQAPAAYGNFGQLELKYLDGVNPYSKTPFHGFQYAVNTVRAAALSSSVPVSPWIILRYHGDCFFHDTDLYQDFVFHITLSGSDRLLVFNPENGDAYNSGDPVRIKKINDSEYLLRDCMKQFDGISGYADKRTLITNLSWWGDDFMLTGMHSGGRNVWRFTPDIDDGSQLSSKLAGTSPNVTFSTGKATIEIPSGVIYSPSSDNCPSGQGYWVLQPAGSQLPQVKYK
jgi:hypothetical protein